MECTFFPLSVSLALSLKSVYLHARADLIADFESLAAYGKGHGNTEEASGDSAAKVKVC